MSRGRCAVAVLFLAVCVQVAEAGPIPYTIVFTEGVSGTLLPTSGSFRYDPATGTFTDFLVVWNGATFDLTSAANSPVLEGGGAAGTWLGTGATTFSMLSGLPSTPCGGWNSAWASSLSETNSQGQFGFFAWTAEGCENETIGFHSVLGASSLTAGEVNRGTGRWTIYQVVVPEAGSTLLLLGAALIGLGAWRPRRL